MSAQAVILAAGKGTRMKSPRPKVLQPVLSLPLLEHVLRAVAACGAGPVTVVVGHGAEQVEAAFAGRGLDFVRQDPPLGTGHALLAARPRLTSPTVLVLNGDLPLLRPATLESLLAAHRSGDAAASLLSVRLPDPGAYGRVLRDPDGGVRAIVEARDASAEELAVTEINVGVYVFETERLLPSLDRLAPGNAQQEYYLTDVIAEIRAGGGRVKALLAGDADEGRGVNSPAELAEASARLRDRRTAELLAAGVILEDPPTCWIGPDVRLEPGAVVRPFSILEGRSVVEAGASVGPFVRLVDVEVGREARILDHCLLQQCRVGAGASVGPFTHVRPETRIGERARVGNFVELKKTVLGDGSKAPHLSYLGDAVIDPSVNVGAGTITCNYDGNAKHPTRIGEGAFVGSNTTLVAPVSVGPGAYVGAGSVVTEDVPADALALGRARQVVKPDWARKRRAARAKPKP